MVPQVEKFIQVTEKLLLRLRKLCVVSPTSYGMSYMRHNTKKVCLQSSDFKVWHMYVIVGITPLYPTHIP